MSSTGRQYHWWETGIIYHIYPLSFQDSNDDGKGDLPGIISRLDYLKWLGIDAIWISSFCRSSMADLGYDVSDYREIDPMIRNHAGFRTPAAGMPRPEYQAYSRFRANHTSDQHPWFKESRMSRTNDKRDWYLWKDPAADGGPPNNWVSAFGGTAWERDSTTGQYYYHAFLKEQPDLNWRNAHVQKEMFDVMRFWLDKGVDGIRVDSMWHLIKDFLFRDNPPNPGWHPGMLSYHRLLPVYSANQPFVHEIVAKMRSVMDQYEDRVLIGETYLVAAEVAEYYGCAKEQGADLPSNFELIVLPWKADVIHAGINRYIAAVPSFGWANWVLSNHDKHRVASRIGRDQARVAVLLQLTLPGTPRIYCGDELGMKNVYVGKGKQTDRSEQQRDGERTPMQWNATRNGGFTEGDPWLPLADDFERFNVEEEGKDASSFLNFYRSLIALRKREPALNIGTYHPVGVNGSVLAFIRKNEEDDKQFLIAVNLGHEPGTISANRTQFQGRIVFGTDSGRKDQRVIDTVVLKEDEAVIVLLEEIQE